SRAGWAFRLSGLVLLIALAAAFGSNRLPGGPTFNRDTFIAAPDSNTPTEASFAQIVPTATQTPPTDPGVAQTVSAGETSIALGVGSETIVSTPSPTATSNSSILPAEDDPTATEPVLIVPTQTTA